MDAKKWLADTAKETFGLNDFEKAKDAFDRAKATSEKADGDISDSVKAIPSYTKDIAVGVGNAALGATKAIVNLIPAAKSRKAADVVSKAALGAFKPKSLAPVKTPGRQFAPKPKTATPSTPRYSDDVKPSTSPEKSTGGYPVTPKIKDDPKAAAKSGAKKPASKAGRAATFAAGYALAGSDKEKSSTNWTPSAIV
jgi:hypothetical protein